MCLTRPAFLGEAVYGHGFKGSPRLRHQAEESREDEGDQRTGKSQFNRYRLLKERFAALLCK